MPDNKRKGSTVADKEAKRAKEGVKGKKKKDPNAPKKPLTAFFIFLGDKRETYLKENPSMKGKNSEIVKALAEVWKKADHKPYEEKAAADKKRYEAEMKNYVPPPAPVDDEPEPKGKEKKKKDPNAPKRALSAYMLFSTAEGPKIRATLKSDPKSAMAKIAEAWKNTDEATKTKFEKLAAEDKKRYEKEMAAYSQKGKSAKKAAEEEEDDDDAEDGEEEGGEEEGDEED